MEKHIATYTIESDNLTQTIALLYEIFQRTAQAPVIVITDAGTYRWDRKLAHQLSTNAITEHDYAQACKF